LETSPGLVFARADRNQESQCDEIRGHRRSAIAEEWRDDTRQGKRAKKTACHHQHRDRERQRERDRQEESIVAPGSARNRETTPDDDPEGECDDDQTGKAELLADRRQHQVGVRFRNEARLAQADARAGDGAGRQAPQRVRHLIAAANRVIPRRQPHL
jgi:hypothetical protein